MQDLKRRHQPNGRAAPPEALHVDLAAGEEPGLTEESTPLPTAEEPTAAAPAAAPVRFDDDALVRQARRLIQEAQAERLGASMVRAVWDAAQMLDPITRIVMARVLVVFALVAASGLTAYTLALTTSWERVATVALFLVFVAWTVRTMTRQQK